MLAISPVYGMARSSACRFEVEDLARSGRGRRSNHPILLSGEKGDRERREDRFHHGSGARTEGEGGRRCKPAPGFDGRSGNALELLIQAERECVLVGNGDGIPESNVNFRKGGSKIKRKCRCCELLISIGTGCTGHIKPRTARPNGPGGETAEHNAAFCHAS
jgi:hypothetical protein